MTSPGSPAPEPLPPPHPADGPTAAQAPAPTVAHASILKRLGPASLLAGVALVLPPVGGTLVLVYMDSIAKWLASHKSEGPLMYAGAFAVCAGLALLPTYAQSILGGWAFGERVGFAAALVGFVGGALIGYAIARPTAAQRVSALIDEHPKWKAVRDALVGGSFWRTLGVVTLVRLPLNSPFALTNLVMASVRVPLLTYMLGTALGMAPRTFAAVWFGAELHSRFATIREGLEAPKPWWWLAAGFAATLAVLVVLGMIATRAVERVAAASPGEGPSSVPPGTNAKEHRP